MGLYRGVDESSETQQYGYNCGLENRNNELKKCLQGDLTSKNLRLNHFVSLHLMKM